ncbi:hypothetical protein ACFPYI_04310 [Halomarina salina]|uniref:Uncharacterized protein n=1 Tax=Halomarina salina TaxID=1872699 RepID=A0ABD5RJN6_9EURY|nr:hypothetical protein [Halomarina salina]
MSYDWSRRTSLQAAWGIGVVSVVAVYVVSVFWTYYGLQSAGYLALGVTLGVPLLALVSGPTGIWQRRTVFALFVFGVVALIVGVIGSGVVSALTAPVNPSEYYYGFDYDWTTNTLRFGLTRTGAVYDSTVHPNRGSVLLGALVIALGLYGRLPERWVGQIQE